MARFKPKKRIRSARACPECGGNVEGHPNKRFCSERCKTNYWRVDYEPVYEPRRYTGLSAMLDQKIQQMDNPIEIDDDPDEYNGPHDC